MAPPAPPLATALFIVFTQVVSPKSFRFMPTRCAGQAQTQTPFVAPPKHFFVFFFQCQRNFNFMACLEVIILKNWIERAF